MTRLRLTPTELAKLSGVNPRTIANSIGGKTRPLRTVERAIEQALSAEEIELRDYLIALHGPPQGEGQ